MALAFNVTPASSLMSPTNGLLAGVAQGAKSFLDAFHEAKMDSLQQQQLALQNQMQRKLYNLDLEKAGFQENPGALNPDGSVKDGQTEFSISQTFLKRQKAMQDLQRQEDVFKTTLQTQADLLKDRGQTVPGLAGYLGNSVGVQLPGTDQSQAPQQGMLPNGLLSPSQPQDTSTAPQAMRDSSGQSQSGLLPRTPQDVQPTATQNAPAAGAATPAASPIPGLGLSPKLKQIELQNQKTQRELNQPTGPVSDAVSGLVKQDIDETKNYSDTLGKYKIVADAKQPGASRYTAALTAVKNLLGSSGLPRGGPIYDDLTKQLEILRKTGPGKLIGRDYDAFAESLKNAMGVMAQNHEFYQNQEAAYGYPAPKGTRALPPIPSFGNGSPRVGDIQQGKSGSFRFMGGNPSDKASWQQVK